MSELWLRTFVAGGILLAVLLTVYRGDADHVRALAVLAPILVLAVGGIAAYRSTWEEEKKT